MLMLTEEDLNTIKVRSFNDFIDKLIEDEKNDVFSEKRDKKHRKNKKQCIKQCIRRENLMMIIEELYKKEIKTKRAPIFFMGGRQYGCKIQCNIIKYIYLLNKTGFDYKLPWSRTPEPSFLTTNKNKIMRHAKKVVDQYKAERKLLNS